MFLGDFCSPHKHIERQPKCKKKKKKQKTKKKKRKSVHYREIRCREIYMFVEFSDFFYLKIQIVFEADTF